MMSHTLGSCKQLAASGARANATHIRSTHVVPHAFKRNSNQQQQQRSPGFIDLPPLPPVAPGEGNMPLPVNNPQQQPNKQQQPQTNPYLDPKFLQSPTANPAANPGPGYAPLDPYSAPRQQPGGYQTSPNRKQNGNGNGGYIKYTDPIWTTAPPSQNGGWNRNNGGFRNNNNNRNAPFQGFDMTDSTADSLLQELELSQFNNYGYPPLSDRWVEEELVEEVEDTSPKYVNGKRVLVNKEIQARTVRVQDAQKQELGVMSYDQAREKSRETDADVVLINEGGDPPVVRLIAFGKYKFELERAAKQKQKSSKGTETKEVRLRPVTEAHDYEVKVKAARGFLAKGSKVKLTMQFSGREMRFKEQGKEMMLKLIDDLSSVSKMDAPLSLRPSNFSVTLSPTAK